MGAAKRSTPGSVAELAKLLNQEGTGGRGRRSALTSWLWANHDEFAAMLKEREPSWTSIAAHLTTMGLNNGKGKPLTGKRVGQAWWNVKQMKTRTMAARRTGVASPVMASDEIAPAVRAMQAFTSEAPMETPVRGIVTSAGATQPSEATEDPMEIFRKQMRAGKVQIPKVVT